MLGYRAAPQKLSPRRAGEVSGDVESGKDRRLTYDVNGNHLYFGRVQTEFADATGCKIVITDSRYAGCV